MQAVFLSPISWEWDTNVTTFSVVFVQKLLYNAEKKQCENRGGKNRLKTKGKRAKQNDKIKKKTFIAVFAEYEFD